MSITPPSEVEVSVSMNEDGTYTGSYTPKSPGQYTIAVSSQNITIAQWLVMVAPPGAPPAPRIPAPPPVVKKSSSSSSSSSEEHAPEPEPTPAPELSEAADTTIGPQTTTLQQYEKAEFKIALSAADKAKFGEGVTVVTYPTDSEENDYTEVFQWTQTQAGDGAWTISYAPDRPGSFIMVVSLGQVVMAQWNVEVTAGMISDMDGSSSFSAPVDAAQSWVDPQVPACAVGEDQTFIIALLDEQSAAAWICPVVRIPIPLCFGNFFAKLTNCCSGIHRRRRILRNSNGFQ